MLARFTKSPTRFDAVMAVLLYGLNVADCFLTLWVVQLAGLSMEANPLMRVAMGLGVGWFLALKLGGGFVLTLALLLYPIPRRFSVALSLVTLVYFVFTLFHLYGIWAAGGA